MRVPDDDHHADPVLAQQMPPEVLAPRAGALGVIGVCPITGTRGRAAGSREQAVVDQRRAKWPCVRPRTSADRDRGS